MSIFVILGLLVCIIEAQGSSAVTPVFVQKGGDVLLNVDADVPENFFFVEWNFKITDILVRFPSGGEPLVSAGSSAVTPVFVQKGGDVLLNVDADVPEDFVSFGWNFNKTAILAIYQPSREPSVFAGYAGRLEFREKKYSVKLKNLQEADRGVYNARLVSGQEVRTLAQYNVIVQNPVSPVELTVISVDSRSSECDLTVTCRTQDSHINSTFRCDNQTCSQEGGEQSEVTTSGASLRIYLLNGSIICNHSNEVSWTEDIKIIKHVCLQPDGSESPPAGISVCLLKIVVFSVGLIIMVSAVITVHLMEKLKKNK